MDTLTPLAITATLLVTVGYVVAVVAWPFKACRRCHGTGRLRSPFGHAFRLCPRCRGTGRRIRLGRHLWNELRRIERGAR